MKIAIIGAGFGGLSAAHELKLLGHEVVMYEAATQAGGLAAGFTQPEWNWSLERHYHHVFTTDAEYLQLLRELGLSKKLLFKRVRSATRIKAQNSALDSPISLLRFPHLSLLARLRTGFGLALLKLMPFGRVFEKWTARSMILATMGEESWRVLWQPLFTGKFGRLSRDINAAWFWARIFARSASLGYYQEGFGACASEIAAALSAKGVQIHYQQPVKSITRHKSTTHSLWVTTRQSNELFDRVLFTTDASITLSVLEPLIAKIAKGGVVQSFVKNARQLQGLGAQTFVMELDRPFFSDGTYWLNINEKGWPFLAVVEQTQLTGSQPYGGRHLVYVAKYLSTDDTAFGKTAEQLLTMYRSFLDILSPGFESGLQRIWVHHERFAQPVVKIGHSHKLPPIATPVEGVYWASMQHVYPFDRGINYAVAIGRKAARQLV
jgi:protoporphyrinogen oxidase